MAIMLKQASHVRQLGLHFVKYSTHKKSRTRTNDVFAFQNEILTVEFPLRQNLLCGVMRGFVPEIVVVEQLFGGFGRVC